MSNVTENQWFELNHRIQRQADKLGLINPLDLFILFFNYDPSLWAGKGLRFALHRAYEQLRVGIAAMAQGKFKAISGTVVFFATEPTHVGQMVPVAETLISEKVPVLFVTTRASIFYSACANELPAYLIGGWGAASTHDLFFPLQHIYKMVNDKHAQPLRSLFFRYYPKLVAFSSKLDNLLAELSPAYTLVGNDLTWEGRLMVRLAMRRNCRTGTIQHGLLGHERVNSHHIVRDFFVYGAASKTILEKDGLKDVNVVATGAPYLDDMQLRDLESPDARIRKTLRLKDRFVLVALSGFGHRTSFENYRLTLEWIDRLVRSHPDLEFVIKLHRKERIESYAMFSTHQKLRIIDRKRGRRLPQNIFDWLRGCSCLITGTSTVAYEAMLCNIPVISIDPLRQFKGVDFIDQRAVEVVHSYEGLEASLRRVNGQRGTADEFIKRIFWRSAIPAREQIARAIVNSALTESAGLSR